MTQFAATTFLALDMDEPIVCTSKVDSLQLALALASRADSPKLVRAERLSDC